MHLYVPWWAIGVLLVFLGLGIAWIGTRLYGPRPSFGSLLVTVGLIVAITGLVTFVTHVF